MPEAEMWKTHRYQGHRVMVIQQWDDPFGRRMIRVGSVDDEGAHAAGMFEADFISEAQPDVQGG